MSAGEAKRENRPRRSSRPHAAFGAGGEDRVQLGGRDVEAGEEAGRPVQVHEFAPARLEELPAPVEADDEQEAGSEEAADLRASRELSLDMGAWVAGCGRSGRCVYRIQDAPAAFYSRGRRTSRAPSRT